MGVAVSGRGVGSRCRGPAEGMAGGMVWKSRLSLKWCVSREWPMKTPALLLAVTALFVLAVPPADAKNQTVEYIFGSA